MTLTLVTRDGEQVAPTCTGPRYRSCGGSIIDHANPRANLTLAEAEIGLTLFRRDARAEPDERRAAQLERWALQLERAILDCRVQRRAAGHSDPHAADRRRA